MEKDEKKVSIKEIFAIIVCIFKFIKDVLIPFYKANKDEVIGLIEDFKSLIAEIKDILGENKNEIQPLLN